MKKTYKAFMQFSLAELKAELDITESGINIGMPTTDVDQYNNMSTESFNINLKDIEQPSLDNMGVPDDMIPKPEDFLYAPFRLLSATMVAAGSWRSTMFPAKVLKKATGMLLKKGVFTDHDDRPKNWTGYVAKTMWQNATQQNGKTIPGGINGLLAIDTTIERNRDIAKGIVSGAVYSNSVGIQFYYKMSHDYETPWEFSDKVGTMHEDGRMVHLEVTEIVDIHETSLVYLGADPYAKRIGNDGLINIDNGGVYEGLTKDSTKLLFKKEYETNKFNIPCGLHENVLLLTGKKDSTNFVANNQNTEIDMNEKILAALLTKFGVSKVEDLTEEFIKDFGKQETSTLSAVKSLALTKVQESNTAIDSVNLNKFVESHVFVSSTELEGLKQSGSKIEGLETKITELEAAKVTLSANAELGEEFLNSQRDLAKKYFRLDKLNKVGAEEIETICGMFDKASPTELQALIKQHGLTIGGQFSYTCGDCGSPKFKFQSSKETEGGESKEDIGLKVVNPQTYRNDNK